MKILILGATGMLGHRLFIELSKHHELWGTVRGETLPSFANRERIITGIHAYPFGEHILRAWRIAQPEVVINCIAEIPQRGATYEQTVVTNAMLPHRLAEICKASNARLIHISTDGVFSGKRFGYTEDDTPDASDVYGLTKRLGEISDQKHVLTLRMCPIGREIGTNRSLVEWFLAQRGVVKGYANAWFNGLTTHEVARIINDYVLPHPELDGVYHVSTEPINKLGLLRLLQSVYNHDVQIIPDDSVQIDRTLDARRFRIFTRYVHKDWREMIETMAADNTLYEVVHASR